MSKNSSIQSGSRNITRHSVRILVLLFTSSASQSAVEPDLALLQSSLDAPALDVARGICSAKQVLKMSEFVESGGNVTIVVGDTEISKNNLAAVRNSMQRRIATYEAAARQRISANVAGTFEARAEKCGNAGAFLAAAIGEGLTNVTVTQNGPDIGMSLRGKVRGKKEKIDAVACLVETSLAMDDPVESGFSYIGEVKEGRILIRPDAETILSGMFPPADRATLEACSITLEPVTKP